jgi:hypothetical protein
MILDTKATLTETLTVSQTAAYLGVSPRTVERYAAMRSYKPLSEVRNGRRMNVYEKYWIDKHFKPVGQSSVGQVAVQNMPVHDTSDKTPSKVVDRLEAEVDFLKQEIEFKNQVISKLQDSQNKLIESDKSTRTFLADLQLQNKTLLLNSSPQAEQKPAEKESRVWLWLGLGISAAVLTGGYFCYEYIATLLK